MKLPSFNKSCFSQLLAEQFPGERGRIELARRVSEYAREINDKEKEVNEATIWRWTKGKKSPPPARFLALARALNVDPFVLLDFSKGRVGWGLLAEQVERNYRSVFPFELNLLLSLMAPRQAWPPEKDGLRALKYHRPWHVVSFQHDPKVRGNYFESILIDVANIPPGGQVWHFAWRDSIGFESGFWLPFGFVRVSTNLIEVHSYNGLFDSLEIPVGAQKFVVETWFGATRAELCIASLHSFNAKLGEVPPLVATVQFRLPE